MNKEKKTKTKKRNKYVSGCICRVRCTVRDDAMGHSKKHSILWRPWLMLIFSVSTAVCSLHELWNVHYSFQIAWAQQAPENVHYSPQIIKPKALSGACWMQAIWNTCDILSKVFHRMHFAAGSLWRDIRNGAKYLLSGATCIDRAASILCKLYTVTSTHTHTQAHHS